MLATLTERRFSDPDWVFERKLDGVRALCVRDGGEVRLWSRARKPMDGAYPEIADALAERGGERFVVDGEIVAFDGHRTSFAALQPRMHLADPARARRSGVKVYFYAFDLLHFGGIDADGLPLRQRKRLLRDAFDFGDPLRYAAHRNGDGERFYAEACAKGWEGVIAKRADAPYTPGRTADWLKFKCVREQEFVVGGFTDPQGTRSGFGALLLGYHDNGALRYAGKVGTGFDEETLRALLDRLTPLEQRASPFDGVVRERGSHWVRPELVIQAGFAEWTPEGKLRHARFAGIRDDKAAADVVREGR
ncbi:non-homologous end-joining DNA ligase [Amycolatopsis samaneae]